MCETRDDFFSIDLQFFGNIFKAVLVRPVSQLLMWTLSLGSQAVFMPMGVQGNTWLKRRHWPVLTSQSGSFTSYSLQPQTGDRTEQTQGTFRENMSHACHCGTKA